MAQTVKVQLVGTLVDDENWPENDETKSVRRENSDTVLGGQETTLLRIDDECAGDEVRLDANVSAVLLSDGTTVRVIASFQLYEGSSCDTTDPEGSRVEYQRNVLNGATQRIDVTVPGDGGGSFRGYLLIANRGG